MVYRYSNILENPFRTGVAEISLMQQFELMEFDHTEYCNMLNGRNYNCM
jgi:hypothetical protein